MNTPACRVCGKREKDHHDFEPEIILPKGCKCDPELWSGLAPIPPICPGYLQAMARLDECATCSHEEACHKPEGA